MYMKYSSELYFMHIVTSFSYFTTHRVVLHPHSQLFFIFHYTQLYFMHIFTSFFMFHYTQLKHKKGGDNVHEVQLCV
jgi:hypothetical protein